MSWDFVEKKLIKCWGNIEVEKRLRKCWENNERMFNFTQCSLWPPQVKEHPLFWIDQKVRSPPLEEVLYLRQRKNDCTTAQMQPRLVAVAQLYDTFTREQMRCMLRASIICERGFGYCFTLRVWLKNYNTLNLRVYSEKIKIHWNFCQINLKLLQIFKHIHIWSISPIKLM